MNYEGIKSYFTDNYKKRLLKLQLILVVEVIEPMYKLTYKLESEDVHIFTLYKTLVGIKDFIRNKSSWTDTKKIIKEFSSVEENFNYKISLYTDKMIHYYNDHFNDFNLQMKHFRALQLFNPFTFKEMNKSFQELKIFPFVTEGDIEKLIKESSWYSTEVIN